MAAVVCGVLHPPFAVAHPPGLSAFGLLQRTLETPAGKSALGCGCQWPAPLGWPLHGSAPPTLALAGLPAHTA